MAGTVSTGRQDLATVPYADKTTFINPWSIMTLTADENTVLHLKRNMF